MHNKKAKVMVFSDLEDCDVLLLEGALKVAEINGYNAIAFMVNSITKAIYEIIRNFKYPSNSKIQFHFSANIATHFELDETDFISGFYYTDWEFLIVPYNTEPLKYSSFKELVPNAHVIAESIKKLKLSSKIETIIAVDNWFQENIQYIKNNTFRALGNDYQYEEINKEAIVPDVLCRYYGVCEDISVSVAVVLTILGIRSDVIRYNEHAWITVEYNRKIYIWDCTHNITRNKNKVTGELKAKEYSNDYTLIGANNNQTYCNKGPFELKVSSEDFDRTKMNRVIKRIKEKELLIFVYSPQTRYHNLNKRYI